METLELKVEQKKLEIKSLETLRLKVEKKIAVMLITL